MAVRSVGEDVSIFRIGLREENHDPDRPRYGIVNVSYKDGESFVHTTIHVRQGQAADYLMRSGSSGSSFGRKFSPFNLTVKAFKNDPGTKAVWHSINLTIWRMKSILSSIRHRQGLSSNGDCRLKMRIWPDGHIIRRM